MGLNSGEVVVGKIGDDLRMDYTAQGHTVGLAQRMEQLASPDTCYVSPATAALVGGYFTIEDLGNFKVKGASAPLRVHRLVGPGKAATRFDVSRSRGLTRFVGRDTDMATLDAALEQSQAGYGQVVGVVAEAGTGKSRLCFEFAERCRARGMTVIEGHALAHGPELQVNGPSPLGRPVYLRNGFHEAGLHMKSQLLGESGAVARPASVRDPRVDERRLDRAVSEVVLGESRSATRPWQLEQRWKLAR
jgi:Adenylate and Guanylate cyclase catalytic domain/AAA ATPase domain